jgi:predicted MPP superfamily phosphohydrolase
MKFSILAIGDVHGRDVLPRIIPDKYDQIVFIGDYVDSHDDDEYPDARILENLEKIIAFKKSYPEKVVLLLGNHDVHYMYAGEVNACSGFRGSMLAGLQRLFTENSSLFDMAYQYRNTLFTHAGVSNAWYREYNAAMRSELQKIKEQAGIEMPRTLAGKFNLLRSTETGRRILFTVSGLRTWPQDLLQSGGIIWADQEETDYDYLRGYHQVVGHTVVKAIEKKMDPYDDRSSITYIDTENRELLEVDI